MMTPDDFETLDQYGTRVKGDFLATAVMLFVYGIYLVLFIASTRILLGRWKENANSALLLGLSIVLFISTSIRLPVAFYITILDITKLFQFSTLDLIDRDAALRDAVAAVSPAIHWTRAVNTIIADAIVVWRACIMPLKNQTACLALIGLMIGNAAMLVLFPIIITFAKEWPEQHRSTIQSLVGVATLLSTITNLCATALIAWAAWRHHKTVKGILGGVNNPQVGTVLLTFVETGVFFVILQFANTLLYWIPPPDTVSYAYASSIFDEIVVGFAAISPVIVIIIVQDKKSTIAMTNNHTYTPTAIASPRTPKSFPPPLPMSATDSSFPRTPRTGLSFDVDNERDSYSLHSSHGLLGKRGFDKY